MPQNYKITHSTLDMLEPQTLEAWKIWNQTKNHGFLFHTPEYILNTNQTRQKDVHLFFVWDNGLLVGLALFLILPIPLKCQLGEVPLLEFNFRRVYLLGESPHLPDELSVYDSIFQTLLSLRDQFELIYLEAVRLNSFFWQYIQTRHLIRSRFLLYTPFGEMQHPLIQFPATYEEYLKKFSVKSRYNLTRELKKFQAAGEVELIEVTTLEQAKNFAELATQISHKTYQYNLLGLGIRNQTEFQARLCFLAQYGWLRSYLLKFNGIACSFLIGYQDAENYYYMDVGYDPEYSKYGVGKMLLLLALQRMFLSNPPKYFDFGMSGGGHKDFFANFSYQDITVFLFSKRPYPLLGYWIYKSLFTLTDVIKWVLERLAIKNTVKRIIRRLSRLTKIFKRF